MEYEQRDSGGGSFTITYFNGIHIQKESYDSRAAALARVEKLIDEKINVTVSKLSRELGKAHGIWL